MNAREITKAMRGHWHGGYGMNLCPCHNDGRAPALKVSDDPRKDDGIDLHCFAGCDWRDVKAELRRCGLLPEWHARTAGRNRGSRTRKRHGHRRQPVRTKNRPKSCNDAEGRVAFALGIWEASRPAKGSLVATYLKARGIYLEVPPDLRVHPSLKHGPSKLRFPSLVAAVRALDGQITAIHRTYLMTDGRGKAQVVDPKLALGPLGNGAARLAPAGNALGLAEGIETGLSAMQLFEIPVWVACGSRMDRVGISPEVIEVQIFGDNGEEGHAAAEKAAEAFTLQGKRVCLRFPPSELGDWNDVVGALHETRNDRSSSEQELDVEVPF